MKNFDLSSFSDKKTAIVLSGGVVKGAIWHLGVAKALENIGFTFKHQKSVQSKQEISTYVGSSAGAMMAIYFASGYNSDDIVESVIGNSKLKKLKRLSYRDMLWLKKKTKKEKEKSKHWNPFKELPIMNRFLLKPILSISGIFSTEGLRNYLNNYVVLGNNFEEYDSDIFIVATALDYPKKVIFSKYNYPSPEHDQSTVYLSNISIAEAAAASMSVPPFYAPYPIFNENTKMYDYYIDGEIRDTLSTHVAAENNCELIISSWSHTPYYYQEEIGSLANYGLPAILLQTILLAIQNKILAARSRRYRSKIAIEEANSYMKSNGFSAQQRKSIVEILERKLNYNPQATFIDIFPESNNYKVFFRNSFSLDPQKSAEIINFAYQRTMKTFEQREWEN